MFRRNNFVPAATTTAPGTVRVTIRFCRGKRSAAATKIRYVVNNEDGRFVTVL